MSDQTRPRFDSAYDPDDWECAGCHCTVTLDDGLERPRHGLCHACATAKLDELLPCQLGAPDFEVFVPGVPRPQGSKNQGRNGQMYDASEYLTEWRLAIKFKALVIYHEPCPRHLLHGCLSCDVRTPPMGGPVVLGVEFLFKRPGTDAARPSGHFRACVACRSKGWVPLPVSRTCSACGGSRKVLRDDAPTYVTCTPDLDKCVRAVKDALKLARVYGDDSQVVGFAGFPLTCKRYANPGEQPGARIRIWRVS